MSTEPRKPPPRIHKAPKRFADEQAEEGPSKKSKTVVSGSAPKPKTTAKEKPTKKPIQPSTSKAAPHVAPSQRRAASVEPVEDLEDRPRNLLLIRLEFLSLQTEVMMKLEKKMMTSPWLRFLKSRLRAPRRN